MENSESQTIVILATGASLLLLITLCSIFSHIPVCVRLAQSITNYVLVNPEQSHLDFDPEETIKLQYREDTEYSTRITTATSQLTLSVNPEENNKSHYVPIPASLCHKLPAGAVMNTAGAGTH